MSPWPRFTPHWPITTRTAKRWRRKCPPRMCFTIALNENIGKQWPQGNGEDTPLPGRRRNGQRSHRRALGTAADLQPFAKQAWRDGRTTKQSTYATKEMPVIYSSNIGHFCQLHGEVLAGEGNHAGIVLCQQQRYGEASRCGDSVRLVDTPVGRGHGQPSGVSRRLAVILTSELILPLRLLPSPFSPPPSPRLRGPINPNPEGS